VRLRREEIVEARNGMEGHDDINAGVMIWRVRQHSRFRIDVGAQLHIKCSLDIRCARSDMNQRSVGRGLCDYEFMEAREFER
jgi:hypothetical protein